MISESDLVLQRAEAAYLGLALGDALGATVEFMTPREIVLAHGVHKEINGGGWLHLKPGSVTDDTTMSIALGEAIIQDQGRVVPLSCAQAFDHWMRQKPVDIGNTVRRNLIAFRRSGVPEAMPNEFDAGNGAAMRVLPVSLATYGSIEAIVSKAVLAQAHTTHHNPVSDAASLVITLIVQDFLSQKSLREVYRSRIEPLLAQYPEFHWKSKRQENPSGWIVHTMQAVFQGLLDTDTFEDLLVDVTNRGGDADTTGAIAGMIGGALYGMESLPKRWLKALNKTVSRACCRQARTLMAYSQWAVDHRVSI